MTYQAGISIRDATVQDATAVQAIYAPVVTGTVISFEETPPTVDEMAERIATYGRNYPFLVAERQGRVVGYAYASAHRDRAAYRWSADVAVYVAEDARGSGIGRGLYDRLLPQARYPRPACRLRGDHAAERGERSAARKRRVRAGGRLPRGGAQVRLLAGRWLVAAAAVSAAQRARQPSSSAQTAKA
jgi:GNAT superfamily N-acetyltransferase